MALEHPSPLVEIESGLLSGILNVQGSRSFLGIPYGAPPTGNLRWRPPERPQPWSGIRAAQRFGASSLQFPAPANSLYYGGETDFSEDCLYLNVFTGPQKSKSRPVLVWFHFGAFQLGSASNPIYSGSALAEEGITVVTVNYRLGRFGFLAHASLTAESSNHTSGNYGIMDQIAALEWVQRNIHAFGGDPYNVAIGGVSAGGSSVHILRSSPLARGLFAKAICESGPGVAPTLNGLGHMAAFTDLASAEEAGEEVFQQLGVASVDDLRQVPAESILTAQLKRVQGRWNSALWPPVSLSVFDTSYPIVDGYVLPMPPLTAMVEGKAADVPVLTGNAGNEGSGLLHLTTLSEYQAYVNETFDLGSIDALRLYPAEADIDVRLSSNELLADQVFNWPVWTAARVQARYMKSSVWYYRQLREPPIPCESEVVERDFAGAFHSSGVLYAFNTLDIWPWEWTDADRALSKRVLSAFTNFMKTGDPNGKDRTVGENEVWSPVAPNTDAEMMSWGADCIPRVVPIPARVKATTAFWDRYYQLELDN